MQKQRPRSKPTTGRSPAADQSRANTYLAEQPPVLVMPQQHKLPRKRKDASVHDKTVVSCSNIMMLSKFSLCLDAIRGSLAITFDPFRAM